jgi:hypothetical protein
MANGAVHSGCRGRHAPKTSETSRRIAKRVETAFPENFAVTISSAFGREELAKSPNRQVETQADRSPSRKSTMAERRLFSIITAILPFWADASGAPGFEQRGRISRCRARGKIQTTRILAPSLPSEDSGRISDNAARSLQPHATAVGD